VLWLAFRITTFQRYVIGLVAGLELAIIVVGLYAVLLRKVYRMYFFQSFILYNTIRFMFVSGPPLPNLVLGLQFLLKFGRMLISLILVS